MCNRPQREICSQKAAIETWCEHWNIKINEDKTQVIYFSYRHGPVGIHLTLKGWNIPFVTDIKYLGVIFDRTFSWKYYIDSITTETLRTFIRIYPLLKSERLSAKSKLTLYKALIRISYACPAWEFAADSHPLKLQRLQNRSSSPLVIHQVAHRPALYT
jgi:hypothetical protein